MTTIEESIINELDYKTFVRIINNIPSCIFYKDTELRYRFSSHCWEQLLSDDIIGKTDLDIRKDKENAAMAMEMDRNIIRSGSGCRYIIKSEIDGHVSYLELIKEPVFDESGTVIGIVGLINDVTEKTVLENRLKELTTTDVLTKTMNRHAGSNAIEHILDTNPKDKAFCLLDLNKFKSVNDTYGHQMGDKVLREFAAALKKSISDTDIVMRLGGDEFIVLLGNIKSTDEIRAFVSALNENIAKININGFNETITCSIGAKKITAGDSFDSLYSVTDKMMYEAKKKGTDCFVIGE